MVTGPSPGQRFAYLDGLRGCAALLVVCNHAIIAADSALLSGQLPDSRNKWDVWLSGTPYFPFDNTGNLAVCLFFVLSGYVLASSYAFSKQSWLALLVKRYARLFIPMLATCQLAWVLLAFHLVHNQPAGLLTHSGWLSAQFLQKPNLAVAMMEPLGDLTFRCVPVKISYDSSLWTMPVEAAGSVLLISLFACLRYAGRYKMALAKLLLGGLGLVLCRSYLGLFCAGALWRLCGPSRAVGRQVWPAVPPLLAGLWLGTMPYSPVRWAIYAHMAAWVQPYVGPADIWHFSAPGFYHALGALVMIGTVSLSSPLQGWLTKGVPQFLGRISFPLYLLHVPLIMVFECDVLLAAHRHGVGDGLGAVLGVGTGMGVALTVASFLGLPLEQAALAAATGAGRAVDFVIHASVRKTLLFCEQKRSKKNFVNSDQAGFTGKG